MPSFIGGSRRLSSKVCHSSAVNPSPKQDVGASRKTKRSLMAGCFGGFGEKKRRKRRKNAGRAGKMKKVNGGYPDKICNKNKALMITRPAIQTRSDHRLFLHRQRYWRRRRAGRSVEWCAGGGGMK
ncbi:hypothetical protein U1Q18_022394 [Sarracenia purpurea var. burkii]